MRHAKNASLRLALDLLHCFLSLVVTNSTGVARSWCLTQARGVLKAQASCCANAAIWRDARCPATSALARHLIRRWVSQVCSNNIRPSRQMFPPFARSTNGVGASAGKATTRLRNSPTKFNIQVESKLIGSILNPRI